MNNPKIAKNVPSEVFLAPLINLKSNMIGQGVDLTETLTKHLRPFLTEVVKSNEALPTMMRQRQLFMLEERLNDFTDRYNLVRSLIEESIADLPRIAEEALRVDSKYREAALRLVYETEQIARKNKQTVTQILEEVELTNSKLLTLC